MKRILLLPGAYNSPSARFRIWQFASPLKKLGYEVIIKVPTPDRLGQGIKGNNHFWVNIPSRVKSVIRFISVKWLLRNAGAFDYIIINRDIVPELKIKNIELNLIQRGCKLIFDFDDAIHLGDRSEKLAKFLPGCYYITPGNTYLAEYALKYNINVQIIPTVVDTEQYIPYKTRTLGKLRVGWSGSSGTNIQCLPLLQNVIETLSKKYDFEFTIISNEDPKIEWKNVKSKFILWTPDTEVSSLQLFDIGLMPLNDSPFEKGKCGLKAIQYMGVGIPALVSPVGVNQEIISHGVDGYHCKNDDDWIKYLELLLINDQLRKEMGEKARIKVENKYSLNSAVAQWANILK